MTLEKLVKDVCIQGNVRLSAWDENGEVESVIRYFDGVEYILSNQIPTRYRKAEVLYIFTPGDGFTHIEVSEPKADK